MFRSVSFNILKFKMCHVISLKFCKKKTNQKQNSRHKQNITVCHKTTCQMDCSNARKVHKRHVSPANIFGYSCCNGLGCMWHNFGSLNRKTWVFFFFLKLECSACSSEGFIKLLYVMHRYPTAITDGCLVSFPFLLFFNCLIWLDVDTLFYLQLSSCSRTKMICK